jgi:predicted aspartyl protease
MLAHSKWDTNKGDMAVKTGYLDNAGHPHIKIKVWGLSDQFGQEFEAMIDTGFSGYLSLPLVRAFPLALTLFGTTQYELADGSMSPKLLAHGSIDHEGEITSGLIALESNANCGPLVGMEFLRQSKKMLLLGKGGVVLLDESPEVITPAEEPPKSPPEEAPEEGASKIS